MNEIDCRDEVRIECIEQGADRRRTSAAGDREADLKEQDCACRRDHDLDQQDQPQDVAAQ